MSLISQLMDAPDTISASSKFTVFGGVFYLLVGLLMLVWPGMVQSLFLDAEFVGNESALFRVVGMCVAVIGWFYFIGGRSGSRQIAAASVIDRLVLVPIVLIPLAYTDVFPHTLMTFAILDPVLGLVAWYLLTRTV